jgi:hypothetical protein
MKQFILAVVITLQMVLILVAVNKFGHRKATSPSPVNAVNSDWDQNWDKARS